MLFFFEKLSVVLVYLFEKVTVLAAGNPAGPPLGKAINEYDGGGSSAGIWIALPFFLYFFFKDLFKSEEEKKKEQEESSGCLFVVIIVVGVALIYYFFFR